MPQIRIRDAEAIVCPRELELVAKNLAQGIMWKSIKAGLQQRTQVWAAFGIVVVASSGCYDAPESPIGPSGGVVASQASSAQRAIATMDDALRQIENLVPGFGGLYVNNDDELVIRLRDASVAAIAPQAILQVLGRLPGRRGNSIRIESAAYTFAELQGWMRQLLRSASFDGISVADVDERDNRVFLGVQDDGVAGRILSDLVRLGIPAGAVTVRTVVPPLKLFANDSLTSNSTPVVGGVMVQTRNWTVGGQSGASKPTCTLGFNAWLLPDTVQLYAITNDHCTQQMGSTSGDTLWQSHYNPGGTQRMIGIEVASAPYRAISDTLCPTGNLCRYSDAALFRYINSSDGLLGDIARPLWYSHGSTPFTLVRDTAEFHINGDLPTSRLGGASPPAPGEWMSKVGATTGWSSGRVGRTCVLVAETPNRRLLCQFEVIDVMSVGADFTREGDSGSPAFRPVYSEDDVYGGTTWLAGILHSGGGSGGSYSFIASDINLLYLDLGQMKTYRGPLCVPDPNYWGCL